MKSEHQKSRHRTVNPTNNPINFLQDVLLENRIIEKLQEKTFPGAAIQQSSVATVAPKTLVPLPNPTIRKLILTAFQPCKYFGTCVEANYQPGSGHVPRGFLGATANLEDVEAVIVLAEPGHPHPTETHDAETPEQVMKSAVDYAYNCYSTGKDLMHRNVKGFLDRLFPKLASDFDRQLEKVWITESRLCSIDDEIGNIGKRERLRCTEYHALRQILCFPNAQVILAGKKAQQSALLFSKPILCGAFSPPGCNHKASRASREEAIRQFHLRGGDHSSRNNFEKC